MPEVVSKEVLDILGMFAAIQDSHKELGPVEGVEEWRIKFSGFDGSNEGEYLAYLKFAVEEQGKYEYVTRSGDGYNSHAPLLGVYRAMLKRFKELGSPRLMSMEQIQDLFSSDSPAGL